jgi:hypothetical protein
MPATVNGPTCGAEGPAAAEAILAQNVAPQPVPQAPSPVRLGLRTSPWAPADPARTPARDADLDGGRGQELSGASPTAKKGGLWAKIQTREDAFDVTKDVSAAFSVVAAVQGGVGALVAPSLLLDAALFAILAAMLRAWKSRMVAVLLLGLTLGAVWMTMLVKLSLVQEGGSNVKGSSVLGIDNAGAVAAFILLMARELLLVDRGAIGHPTWAEATAGKA